MQNLLLLIFTILFPVLAWSHPNLEKVTLEDRLKLEIFFDYLIHNSTIGYSLCGNKPVSMETFPALAKISPQYAVKIFAKHQGYSMLWNGIEAWQRNCHLFPSRKFVFRFVPNYNTIVFINKNATLKIIEDNLDLFQKYANTEQTAIEFLEDVCIPKDKDYMIQYNTALLGILLGYGKNNALAFSEKMYFQKLEGFKLYNSSDIFNEFINPGFKIINNGTNDLENNSIRNKLRKAKRKITCTFKKNHFFESFINFYTQ